MRLVDKLKTTIIIFEQKFLIKCIEKSKTIRNGRLNINLLNLMYRTLTRDPRPKVLNHPCH